MRPSVRLAVLLGALALARPLAQQAPPPASAQGAPGQAASQQQPDSQQPQQPVFRSGINFVRVDVIVSDPKGNPVGDLKAEDFEVTEGGKPQTIEAFKLIQLDGGVAEAAIEAPQQIRSEFDEEAEAARDDVRLFAVFLDDYHVRRG